MITLECGGSTLLSACYSYLSRGVGQKRRRAAALQGAVGAAVLRVGSAWNWNATRGVLRFAQGDSTGELFVGLLNPNERFHQKFGANIPQHLLVRRVGVVEFQANLLLVAPPGDDRGSLKLPPFPR